MKKIIAVLCLVFIKSSMVLADDACYSECASWDTFCKSPEQIVATKCRLGVPVDHAACKNLGIKSHYLMRGGGSLVKAMPCSSYTNKVSTDKNKALKGAF